MSRESDQHLAALEAAREVIREHGLMKQAVGVCGFCGSAVLAERIVPGGLMLSYVPQNARCSGCGARPKPLKMYDRRKASR